MIGENGETIKRLQQTYNVSIRIKHTADNSKDMSRDFKKSQSTCLVILTGESTNMFECQTEIESLIGNYVNCDECQFLVSENDGKHDPRGGIH